MPGNAPLPPGKLSAVGKKRITDLFIAVVVVVFVVVQTVQNKVLN